ncbi:MAG: hypothetical protein MJB57_02770 [Gemmatimonadetes bacterium]|nr:hypothetical protein [Gemmatimonadota bacterium]
MDFDVEGQGSVGCDDRQALSRRHYNTFRDRTLPHDNHNSAASDVMAWLATPSAVPRKHLWLGAILLIAISLPPRVAQLSNLSFHGDEETTALAARSLVETGTAQMPSGMEYRRALPYTWLNAVIAGRVGLEREASYRMGPALIGSLTPAALFVVGSTMVGAVPAFAAGALLSVSEWHLVFSRLARMYSPFILFYFLAGCWLWRWATTGRGRYLALGSVAFAATISMHALGIFVVQYAVLPIAFAGAAAVSVARMLSVAAIGAGLAAAYDRFFVQIPYRAWPGLEAGRQLARDDLPPVMPTVGSIWIVAALVGLGLGFAAYLFLRSRRDERPPAVPIVLCLILGLAAAMVSLGQLAAAAAMALVGLIVDRPGLLRMASRERLAVGALCVIGLAWTAAMVVSRGPVEGIKAVIYFPYPYAITLLQQQPATVGLAGVAILWTVFTRADAIPVRAMALSVILPILAIGAVLRWGAPRYFAHLYPFVVLLAALSLAGGVAWILTRAKLPRTRLVAATLGVSSLVVGSGLLRQHGVPQAIGVTTLEHGDPTDPALHARSFRADHALPGDYVRENAAEDDIVIAVDVLEQAWYVGEVDYWLRGENDAYAYLYSESDEPGVFREFYASSELLRSRSQFDRLLAENPDRRIWLTTSGEIGPDDEVGLPQELRDVIAYAAATGVEKAVGRDGVTRVYCLHCE